MREEIVNWEEESKRFDEAADYYDQYRPSYPQALIDKIIGESKLEDSAQILEVGAGSGKATALFVDRGYRLTCIEPGANLAAIGEKKFQKTQQVKFITTRLEHWQEEPDTYDLAISAQAFHWVPKPIGYHKCAKSLKDNRYLCLFWNMYLNDLSDVGRHLRDVCKGYGVLLLNTKEEIEKRIKTIVQEIEDSSVFNIPNVYQFPWSVDHNVEEFICFLKTGNGYLGLEEDRREELNNQLEQIFHKAGGMITRKFICVLFMAQKK